MPDVLKNLIDTDFEKTDRIQVVYFSWGIRN